MKCFIPWINVLLIDCCGYGRDCWNLCWSGAEVYVIGPLHDLPVVVSSESIGCYGLADCAWQLSYPKSINKFPAAAAIEFVVAEIIDEESAELTGLASQGSCHCSLESCIFCRTEDFDDLSLQLKV